MNAPSRVTPTAGSRDDQALAFISEYLIEKRRSPSIPEIADRLQVSRTRARQIVHRLAQKRAIDRAPGSQRAISVPGLFDTLVIDRLKAEGWVVNAELRTASRPGDCPKEQLALIAELDHVPDDIDG